MEEKKKYLVIKFRILGTIFPIARTAIVSANMTADQIKQAGEAYAEASQSAVPDLAYATFNEVEWEVLQAIGSHVTLIDLEEWLPEQFRN